MRRVHEASRYREADREREIFRTQSTWCTRSVSLAIEEAGGIHQRRVIAKDCSPSLCIQCVVQLCFDHSLIKCQYARH
jgi:hypothetical protein